MENRARRIPRPVLCALGGVSGRSRSGPLPSGGGSCMLCLQLRKELTPMKVTVEERPGLEEPEVIVRCGRMDGRVSRLVELLRLSGARLTGERDGQTCILEEDDVLYIDTADRVSFLYTADELEEQLAPRDFVRVSKSAIVNFDQVKSLRPDLGGRLRLTLSNGEVVVANRQYVPAIKKKLGL